MKLLTAFAVMLLIPLLSTAQQGNQTTSTLLTQNNTTNIKVYNLDYELIDHVFIDGDSTILNELNISGILHARKYDEDIVITDLQHNVRILLYSELRAKEERGNNVSSPNNTGKSIEP